MKRNKLAGMLLALISVSFVSFSAAAVGADVQKGPSSATLADLQRNFLTADSSTDLNRDGIVNFRDVAQLQSHDDTPPNAGPQRGGNLEIWLVARNPEATIGDVLEVDVMLDLTARPALGGALELAWDPSVFEFLDWTQATSTLGDDPLFHQPPDVDPSLGIASPIVIGSFFGSPGVAGLGIAGTLTLLVTAMPCPGPIDVYTSPNGGDWIAQDFLPPFEIFPHYTAIQIEDTINCAGDLSMSVMFDLDGDGISDSIGEVLAGTPFTVQVFAQQGDDAVSLFGGLNGFGLEMSTDGLTVVDNSAEELIIDSQWDFATRNVVAHPTAVLLEAVGNTLAPAAFENPTQPLFEVTLLAPSSAGQHELKLRDIAGDSFVSRGAHVYDDDVFYQDTLVKVVLDSDLDGVFDNADNCTFLANPTQTDSDQDGFGNPCDGDLNNDCTVDFEDLAEMKAAFFGGPGPADLDANGTVDFTDLAALKNLIFAPPGPSEVPNSC